MVIDAAKRHRAAHAEAVRDLPTARHSRSSRSSTRWTGRRASRWKLVDEVASTAGARHHARLSGRSDQGRDVQRRTFDLVTSSRVRQRRPGRRRRRRYRAWTIPHSSIELIEDECAWEQWREDEIQLARDACSAVRHRRVPCQGTLTPVFFGSVRLKNFGVRSLLDALVALCAAHRATRSAAATREVKAERDPR